MPEVVLVGEGVEVGADRRGRRRGARKLAAKPRRGPSRISTRPGPMRVAEGGEDRARRVGRAVVAGDEPPVAVALGGDGRELGRAGSARRCRCPSGWRRAPAVHPRLPRSSGSRSRPRMAESGGAVKPAAAAAVAGGCRPGADARRPKPLAGACPGRVWKSGRLDREERLGSMRPAPRHRRHPQERGALHPRMGRLPPGARRRPLLRRRQRRDDGSSGAPRRPRPRRASSTTCPSPASPACRRSCRPTPRSCAATAPRPTGSPSSTPTSSCCRRRRGGACARSSPPSTGRPEVGAVAVNWALYGSSGETAARPEPVIERFPPGDGGRLAAPPPLQDHPAAARPSPGSTRPRTSSACVRHLPPVHADGRAGRPLPGGLPGLSRAVVWAPLRLNHYVVKSREEFLRPQAAARPRHHRRAARPRVLRRARPQRGASTRCRPGWSRRPGPRSGGSPPPVARRAGSAASPPWSAPALGAVGPV